MNLLFLGSGAFGLPTLEALAERAAGRLHVATVPDAPRDRRGQPEPTVIKARAAALGLPCSELATLKKPHGVDLLERSECELVITADIRLILPPSFLKKPQRGCFNLHGSLLPRYRGAAPVARGILAGDQRFGVTLYRMVRELDAGPIVAEREYSPAEKLSAPEVERVLSELAAELTCEWLERLEAGDIPLREQDESAVTLAPRLEKKEGWIPWQRGASEIEDRLLALTPWPRSFSCWVSHSAGGGEDAVGERIFVERAQPMAAETALEPGTVRAVSSTGIDVACGADGSETLRLLELQRAGKKSLDVAQFLNGCRVVADDRFVSEEQE